MLFWTGGLDLVDSVAAAAATETALSPAAVAAFLVVVNILTLSGVDHREKKKKGSLFLCTENVQKSLKNGESAPNLGEE